MPRFTFEQPLRQLEARKGGYYFFKVMAEQVNQFEKKRATRLVCSVNQELSYSCGLNHYGDGNYFIIFSGKNVKKLGASLGDIIEVSIEEDPNPLGVAIPEILLVLLEQDPEAKAIFERITDGKKRSLIHTINRIKDIDKQVQTSMKFLATEDAKLAKKKAARSA